jgi:hypothetical protein
MFDTNPYSLTKILIYLTQVTVLVAGISGLVLFRRQPYNLRCLALLTIFELPLDLLGFALYLQNRSNLFLMPVYTIGELGLLAWLYKRTLNSITFAHWIPWVIGSFVLYTIADSLLGPGLHWFRPGQQIVQSLLILGMVGLYFRKLLSELRVPHLTHEPMFWVSTGLLIYFLGYLQIALFSNYLLQHYSVQFNRNVWSVHTLLSIVLHSCYCLALWMRPQR